MYNSRTENGDQTHAFTTMKLPRISVKLEYLPLKRGVCGDFLLFSSMLLLFSVST